MKSITKILGLVGFTIILFVFQSSLAFAKDLSVVTVEKSDQIEELMVSEDSIINAEDSILIPKLTVKDGAEVVEVNATVANLEVASKNKVVLNGKGDITNIIITTGNEVILNTTGNINKIEVINKDARLVVSEGTKIAKLIIPEGSKVTDIITNFEQAKDRFENISGGTVIPEPTSKPTPTPTPTPTPEPEPTPGDDFNFIGEKGNSSFTVDLKHLETSKVGTIPSGVSNLYIKLLSEVDVDLEIWEEEESGGQIPILVYGNQQSIQGDADTQVTWTYQGLQFTYSGWRGVNNQEGHEWITIEGTTDRNYTIKVKNYEDDTSATVNYSWGNEGESSTWVQEED